jgi:uncharacterized membrane protein
MLDNFRTKLRQEAQLWRDEGLISSSFYNQLADRYQFNKLEAAAKNQFNMILIGVGSILLASGVIIFIAANWQVWSREAKVVLLFSLFLTISIVGYNFWKEPKPDNEGKKSLKSNKKLGEALLMLAAFILGVNIAVMGELYNPRGSRYELFLAWGLGVLTMAWGLRSLPLAIFGVILTQAGYWTGIGELRFTGELTWARLLVQHMPLFSWLVFIPLAYWVRSRWVFALGAIAFASSLQFNLNSLQLLSFSQAAPWLASFAFALPPALFWSYDDLLFPEVNYKLFQPLARTLTLLFFSIIFYLLSFSWWWENRVYNSVDRSAYNTILRSFPLIDLGILSGLAVIQWLYLFRHRPNRQFRALDLNSVFIASFIFITALVPFLYQASSRISVFAVFVFNVLLALLGSGLIREGVEFNSRRLFWAGLMLITLQILTRMLESDNSWLFKSLVFFLCGWGVIAAGLWFEQRTKKAKGS